MNAFWIYQRERFPLATHGLLVAVIGAAGVGFSHAARGAAGQPSLATFLTAFVGAFGFFFQLRVADEFKDYADDLAHRPYRPVPRGVISLSKLATLALGVALAQITFTWRLSPGLLIFLMAVWGYMLLMRVEFFAPRWLRARPLVYMLSHMVVTPLIFLYITACDWRASGASPPPGLGWFLVVAFFNGMVFEIGRKIRAPEDEETGVETYSFLWGRRNAVLAWWSALALAGVCVLLAARPFGREMLAGGVLLALLAGGAWIGWRFLQSPSSPRAEMLDHFSGLWTLLLYAFLGVGVLLPLI
jgi:4-hydroxybenzoate polyprenyltransferase